MVIGTTSGTTELFSFDDMEQLSLDDIEQLSFQAARLEELGVEEPAIHVMHRGERLRDYGAALRRPSATPRLE